MSTYMDVPLGLRFDDGIEHRVVARPRDLMAWQKTARSNITLEAVLPINAAGDGLDFGKFNMPELYRLAWTVARREGLFDGTVDQFGEQVDVTVLDDDRDEAARPTNAAPSAASLSSSPSKPASRRRPGQTRGPGPS